MSIFCLYVIVLCVEEKIAFFTVFCSQKKTKQAMDPASTHMANTCPVADFASHDQQDEQLTENFRGGGGGGRYGGGGGWHGGGGRWGHGGWGGRGRRWGWGGYGGGYNGYWGNDGYVYGIPEVVYPWNFAPYYAVSYDTPNGPTMVAAPPEAPNFGSCKCDPTDKQNVEVDQCAQGYVPSCNKNGQCMCVNLEANTGGCNNKPGAFCSKTIV